VKKTFYLILLLLSCLFIYSAQSEDINLKIKNIKTWYKEIQSNRNRFTKKNIDFPDEGGIERSVSILKSGNELKIIIIGEAGGDCGEGNTIYYKNSQPFFVLYEYECFVGNIETKDVNRYYLDNGKLIQFLEGNKKKVIKPGTSEFIFAESNILEIINDAKKYNK
jgi:hypothetical protein